MSHPLLSPEAGGRHLLLGNEAVVRGALEAGVNIVTCYPGTPSSEVPDTFRRMLPSDRYRVEYAVNEKVAVEVAAGAALAGAMCLVTMKHVGVNVAADPLFTAAYMGLPGGLVLLSADDPFCHSSQDEQDNRAYARFMGLPCFEPASAQEAKDMARDALLLARELAQPVMLRTTTRVNHLRGRVDFGPLPEKPAPVVTFERNPGRFVPVPGVARARHRVLAQKLEEATALSDASPWNKVTDPGETRIGVVASGISRAYLADALAEHGWEKRVKVFELGFSWPLPEKRLGDFLTTCDTVLVLEELEPLVERDLRALAQERGIPVKIVGKDGPLTIFGEYSTGIVAEALALTLGEPLPASGKDGACAGQTDLLPGRPPNLCAGCSHRAVYYAVRKVFGDDAVYSSDIGCYTLGMAAPLRAADFLFCMGSSVSAGSGFAMVSDRPVVGFIGDSTFFHSGITGLANAVFNKHNLLLVILDNGTTAMTGHQPNPGVVPTVLGDDCEHLDIEAIVRGVGVTDVVKVKPFNTRATVNALEAMKARTGVRVIIAEEPCMLFAKRTLKRERARVAQIVRQDADVLACMAELACPAFRQEDGNVDVDPTLCSGCMVCLQNAPSIRACNRSESHE